MPGYVGELPGMYYDGARDRYFPASLKGPGLGVGTGGPPCDVGRARARAREPEAPAAGPSRRRRTLPRRRADLGRLMTEDRVSRLADAGTERYCGCAGETVTSLRSFPTGGHYATTDHGKIVMHRPDGQAFQITVCTQRLLGMHVNVPWMSYTAVANGPEPHLHLFRRDPSALDHFTVGQTAIDLPPSADIFAMASFASSLTLAASRCLVAVDAAAGGRTSRRRLASDPLALDHADAHVVLAGLRSGALVVDDARAPPAHARALAVVPRGKAVIGVRRLSDAAVPFGVVASALDHTLVLFDARFARAPLRAMHHVNQYNTDLALATTPDDLVVFAAGSDNRLRAYSTVTGDPVVARPRRAGAAPGAADDSPFAKVFDARIEHVDVGADELRVVEGQSVTTYAVEDAVTVGYDADLD